MLPSSCRLSSTRTRPPTRCGCRRRSSWITWSATSTTPCLESSTTPFTRKHHRAAALVPLPPSSPLLPPASSFSFGVVPSPRSRGKLANVNSSRQSVGNLAASLWGFFPLQQPNAFFSSFIFCIAAVRIQLISACHSGLKQPTVTEIGSVS